MDERTNYLIVEATPNNLVQVEAVLKELDIKTDQVLIEARMVEASTSFVRSLGVQWQPLFSMAPATGNATGLPFPNAITGNGGAVDSASSVAPFPNSTPFAVNLPSSVETGALGWLVCLSITFGIAFAVHQLFYGCFVFGSGMIASETPILIDAKEVEKMGPPHAYMLCSNNVHIGPSMHPTISGVYFGLPRAQLATGFSL